MTDADRSIEPARAVAGMARGGAVIVRARLRAERLKLLESVIGPARRAGCVVLVSDDARLATKADGLHIPEKSLRGRAMRWRRFRRRLGLVTASAHSHRAVRDAIAWGVDAILLSPVFATISHPGQRPLGIIRFMRLRQRSTKPVIALGGVVAQRGRALRRAGAAGMAGIGMFKDYRS